MHPRWSNILAKDDLQEAIHFCGKIYKKQSAIFYVEELDIGDF